MIETALMASITLVGSLIGAVLGGTIYRIRGGMSPDLPHLVEQSLWSLMVNAPAIFVIATMPFSWLMIGLVTLSFALTFLATTTGHGDGIDFGRSPDTDPDEWPNLIVGKVGGGDGYLHDFLFMILNGASITIAPAALLLYLGLPYFALVMFLNGMLKGIGYLLGALIHDYVPEYVPPKIKEFGRGAFLPGAPLGEWFTGAFVVGVSTFLTVLLYFTGG